MFVKNVNLFNRKKVQQKMS